VKFVNDEQLQAWRRTRLEALANKLGGKAALGRKLGYVDGAFVGQMISGLRPVTEKTIRAAEALQGCRGWFSFLPPEEMPSPADKYAQVLRDLEDIPPPRRHRLLDEIQEAADQAREAAAYLSAREGKQPQQEPESAADKSARVAASGEAATVGRPASSKRWAGK
jgi:hypothetical protein